MQQLPAWSSSSAAEKKIKEKNIYDATNIYDLVSNLSGAMPFQTWQQGD